MLHSTKLIFGFSKLTRSAIRSQTSRYPKACRKYFSSHFEKKNACKLVIFDKDGTLTCYSSMWGPWCEVTASRLQKASGRDLEDDIYEFFNYDKKAKKLGKSSLSHDTHEVVKCDLVNLLVENHGMEENEATSLVSEAWLENFDISETGQKETIQPLGDVKKIFTDLKKRGIKIAVCTSDSRGSVKTVLKGLGVSDMVDRLVCGDDPDNTAKPAPENVHLICNDLGIESEETVVIGDTHYDTVMGRKSNCGVVIGVLSGLGEEKDLKDADFIVQSIDEALPILLNDGGSPQNRFPTRISNKSSFLSPSKEEKCTRSFSTSARIAEDFTHIIVGAGSAGCVLANRLTEDSSNSVLLIEAGPKDTILNSLRLL